MPVCSVLGLLSLNLKNKAMDLETWTIAIQASV